MCVFPQHYHSQRSLIWAKRSVYICAMYPKNVQRCKFVDLVVTWAIVDSAAVGSWTTNIAKRNFRPIVGLLYERGRPAIFGDAPIIVNCCDDQAKEWIECVCDVIHGHRELLVQFT